MDTAPRVKRLRELVAQIELLPASPDRDRMLSEFRSRAVDVDTGVKPRAILPSGEQTPAVVPVRPSQRERAPRVTPPESAPAVKVAPLASAAGCSKGLHEPFMVDERLSLEDALRSSQPPPVRMRGDRPVPPWTLGLRG
jgi:hypothetical protein